MCTSIDHEDVTDDEFDLETAQTEKTETVQQRLKEFTYYLVENIESGLNFFLQLLEERPVTDRSNSIHVTALSALCSAIPSLPGGVGKALKAGETTIFRKIEKKNSKKLADLVYYFGDNRETFRDTIIDAAVEVFGSFENQFIKLTCNGGENRAMQKLAIDASDRIFKYFLMSEQDRNVTKIEIIKGIIYGQSKRNKIGFKEGKQVENDEIKWKTCDLYSKVGILVIEDEKKIFYRPKGAKPEKYGYRKIFSFEDPDEIKKTCTPTDDSDLPKYFLENSEDLENSIKDFIATKNPYELAKLERKKYNAEALADRKQKQEEYLDCLKRCFNQVFDSMQGLIVAVNSNEQSTNALVETVRENRKEDEDRHVEIVRKLDEVHVDVTETKQNQKLLITTSETIKDDIVVMKSNQEDLATAVVTEEQIKNIIKSEAKRSTVEGIKEVVGEAVRKIPVENVKKEFERTVRVAKELKTTEKIKKVFNF